MSFNIQSQTVFCLLNTNIRVNIQIVDASGAPVDPVDLKLTVMNTGGSIKLFDEWPAPASRIIQSSTGNFYITFGQPTAALNGAHISGLTTLTIQKGEPPEDVAWPNTGNLIIDRGTPNQEMVGYSDVDITDGAGTITLTRPLAKSHGAGAVVFANNQETNSLQEWLFNWESIINDGDAPDVSIIKLKVISPRMASLIPEFRLMIDKTVKLVNAAKNCFLGYTDSNLVSYLEGGLGTINAYQPSLTFTFENFPFEYKQIIIDAGLITGVMSQQLYAVDTDIPSYSDQGTSFVIQHQPQLAGFLNQVSQRLDRLIPMMKLQLLQPGSLHVQAGPDFRLSTLVDASPNGSLFRGVYFHG